MTALPENIYLKVNISLLVKFVQISTASLFITDINLYDLW